MRIDKFTIGRGSTQTNHEFLKAVNSTIHIAGRA